MSYNIVPVDQDLADFHKVKHMVNRANYYMPYIPDDVSKVIHEFGALLVRDDASDIGYFSYRNRTTHYYFGRQAPHHPSPWHHWQGGAFMMLIGMLGSLFAKFGEALMQLSGVVDEMDNEFVNQPASAMETQIDMMLRQGSGGYEYGYEPQAEIEDPNMIRLDPSMALHEIEPELEKKEIRLPQLPI